MASIVLFMSVSVDGYMSGPNGELDWHRVDDELHAHFNAVLRRMSAFLDGRRTYELMAEFWPTADRDPSAPGPVKQFAEIWREMPKIVYSTTLERADWNATIIREVDPGAVRELKERLDGDVAVGGAELARAFMAYDLIDEYRLYVHPVVIGRGKRLFEPADISFDLRLIENHAFGNGVVLLRYERDRG
ncbi:MAG: dihydrofolate reductase family protein [Actinomycetota bacterium]